MMLEITNIAAYRFVRLTDLPELKNKLFKSCEALNIKGTVLISQEGINLILAGSASEIEEFIGILTADLRFKDMEFKKSFSEKIPFRRLRVRIKKEIITLKQNHIDPLETTGHYLPAAELKRWLDEQKDFVLLDTRNRYEFEVGTFEKAVTLPIDYFSEFPQAVNEAQLPKDKPVVMFCTGGIRCEKASAVLMQSGYNAVYQLEGGILKYFENCGGAHYQGNCFVFDDRTAITARLEETGLFQCPRCSHFLTQEEQKHPDFVAWKQCQFCQGTSDNILKNVA